MRNDRFLIGIDEVGRAAWAGPLTVGLAAAPESLVDEYAGWVKDIKLLNDQRREDQYRKLAEFLGHPDVFWKVVHMKVYKTYQNLNEATIDGALILLNYVANWLTRNTGAYSEVIVIMDNVSGNRYKPILEEQIYSLFKNASFVMEPKADNKYPIVSVASAIAKHRRDKLMARLDSIYFDKIWKWVSNKGYPDRHQFYLVKQEGFSPFHRSFMNYYGLKQGETKFLRSW